VTCITSKVDSQNSSQQWISQTSLKIYVQVLSKGSLINHH